jgi:hypothetical protein
MKEIILQPLSKYSSRHDIKKRKALIKKYEKNGTPYKIVEHKPMLEMLGKMKDILELMENATDQMEPYELQKIMNKFNKS